MRKKANKSRFCAKNCEYFKTQELDLAKSDVCVTVNLCTLYDKSQIAQNLAVYPQRVLYDT